MTPTDRSVRSLAQRYLRKLGERDAAFDIFLLPHAEIKELKARFFRRRTEPNVLSFSEPRLFPHPELSRPGRGAKRSGGRSRRYIGEIYLNRDILRRSPERTAPLLLHGILHLLGYDHLRAKDAAVMEELEDRLLLGGRRT